MLQRQLHINQVRNTVTIVAAFLLGLIDSYTVTEFQDVLASAQIGNMVT